MSRPDAPSAPLATAEALAASGVLRGARVVSRGGGVEVVGEVDIGDRWVALCVELGDHFPAVAPVLRLVHPTQLGNLPHVNRAGVVCLARQETILLDPGRPMDALVALVERARDVLRDGWSGRRQGDIQEEWDAYWRAQPGVVEVRGHVHPGGGVRPLLVQKRSKNDPTPQMVADNLAAHTSYYARQPWCGDLRDHGLFIPLPVGFDLAPPLPGEVWQARDYRDRILARLPTDTRRAIQAHTRRYHREEVVVFSLPRRHGGATLFGVSFQRAWGGHPLGPAGGAGRTTPLAITRLDATLLRPRGGADAGLSEARVAVVGCGSVGGYVAAELARAGIGHLDLVDGDTLRVENTYRHHLSRAHLGENKANALCEDLRDRIPYLQVRPYPTWLEELTPESISWSDVDVCVFATGRAGVELAWCERFFRTHPAPRAALHTWLEPLGIGGHVLLSLPRDRRPGCLRCLYTDPDGWLCPCRAALADPHAEADLDLSGCGSRFTPFANLDALRTATLATEVALMALRTEVRDATLRTWTGDADALTRDGIRTTGWYGLGHEQRAQVSFIHPRCPVCGGMP